MSDDEFRRTSMKWAKANRKAMRDQLEALSKAVSDAKQTDPDVKAFKLKDAALGLDDATRARLQIMRDAGVRAVDLILNRQQTSYVGLNDRAAPKREKGSKCKDVYFMPFVARQLAKYHLVEGIVADMDAELEDEPAGKHVPATICFAQALDVHMLKDAYLEWCEESVEKAGRHPHASKDETIEANLNKFGVLVDAVHALALYLREQQGDGEAQFLTAAQILERNLPMAASWMEKATKYHLLKTVVDRDNDAAVARGRKKSTSNVARGPQTIRDVIAYLFRDKVTQDPGAVSQRAATAVHVNVPCIVNQAFLLAVVGEPGFADAAATVLRATRGAALWMVERVTGDWKRAGAKTACRAKFSGEDVGTPEQGAAKQAKVRRQHDEAAAGLGMAFRAAVEALADNTLEDGHPVVCAAVLVVKAIAHVALQWIKAVAAPIGFLRGREIDIIDARKDDFFYQKRGLERHEGGITRFVRVPLVSADGTKTSVPIHRVLADVDKAVEALRRGKLPIAIRLISDKSGTKREKNEHFNVYQLTGDDDMGGANVGAISLMVLMCDEALKLRNERVEERVSATAATAKTDEEDIRDGLAVGGGRGTTYYDMLKNVAHDLGIEIEGGRYCDYTHGRAGIKETAGMPDSVKVQLAEWYHHTPETLKYWYENRPNKFVVHNGRKVAIGIRLNADSIPGEDYWFSVDPRARGVMLESCADWWADNGEFADRLLREGGEIARFTPAKILEVVAAVMVPPKSVYWGKELALDAKDFEAVNFDLGHVVAGIMGSFGNGVRRGTQLLVGAPVANVPVDTRWSIKMYNQLCLKRPRDAQGLQVDARTLQQLLALLQAQSGDQALAGNGLRLPSGSRPMNEAEELVSGAVEPQVSELDVACDMGGLQTSDREFAQADPSESSEVAFAEPNERPADSDTPEQPAFLCAAKIDGVDMFAVFDRRDRGAVYDERGRLDRFEGDAVPVLYVLRPIQEYTAPIRIDMPRIGGAQRVENVPVHDVVVSLAELADNVFQVSEGELQDLRKQLRMPPLGAVSKEWFDLFVFKPEDSDEPSYVMVREDDSGVQVVDDAVYEGWTKFVVVNARDEDVPVMELVSVRDAGCAYDAGAAIYDAIISDIDLDGMFCRKIEGFEVMHGGTRVVLGPEVVQAGVKFIEDWLAEEAEVANVPKSRKRRPAEGRAPGANKCAIKEYVCERCGQRFVCTPQKFGGHKRTCKSRDS